MIFRHGQPVASSVSAPPRSAPDATPRRTEADRPTTLRLTSRSPPRRLVLALGREDSWHRSVVPGRRSPAVDVEHPYPSKVRTRVSPVHASDALHQGSTAAPTTTSVAATRSAAAPAVQGGCGTRRSDASKVASAPRPGVVRTPSGWDERRRQGAAEAPRSAARARGWGRSLSERDVRVQTSWRVRLRNTMLKLSRSIVNAPTADPVDLRQGDFEPGQENGRRWLMKS